jgi:cysteine desulfurase
VPGYLDHASSEPLSDSARATWLAAVDSGWADPERLHSPARQARLLLDNARAAVAESLGVRADEVSFTASGTQAVHLGVLGLLTGRRRTNGRRLLLTAVEHSAVFAAGRWWAGRAGAREADAVETLEVDALGRLRPGSLEEALATPGGVAAVQHANPEVGTLQPLEQLAGIAAARDVPLFVDACATAALLPLPRGWHAAALSAHKWGGPAGVGVLLVRKGSRWRPPFPTDERGDPRVSGFENVPAVLAAAAALQARVHDRETLLRSHRSLARRLVSGLETLADVDLHGPPVDSTDRVPHVISCSFLYADGETLVHELDRRGIRVASGSACTASALEPSHVLAAMGALTHGNLRVSFGPDTTEADVDHLVSVLHEVVPRLREGLT